LVILATDGLLSAVGPSSNADQGDGSAAKPVREKIQLMLRKMKVLSKLPGQNAHALNDDAERAKDARGRRVSHRGNAVAALRIASVALANGLRAVKHNMMSIAIEQGVE
jgi:hypothetical protein